MALSEWKTRLDASWRRLRRICGEELNSLGALMFPWECPICGAEGEGTWPGAPFCLECRADLVDAAGLACPRCAMPVGPWGVRPEGCAECRDRRGLGFDAAVALGPYQGPIRDLCLRLKREPNAWIAPWLIDVLLDGRPRLRAEFCAGPNRDAWVVPVPLHWRRYWRRGYNQADELAEGLAARLGLERKAVLRRIRSTRILAGLGRVERTKLLRGAFHARDTAGLKGRTILLVDDVLTTGATCGAAARALKRAGAARVVAVVVARAGGRAETQSSQPANP